MSTRPYFSESSQFEAAGPFKSKSIQRHGHHAEKQREAAERRARADAEAGALAHEELSRWSGSIAKRMFDCVSVLLAMPVLIPVFLLVGLAVRLTSRGPVLFLQKRMGRHNRPFTILKFRSMLHVQDGTHNPVTTTENQRFTPIGRFLRRWKLDELPQVLNVLAGEMSLVGPRPKLLSHQVADLCCRPGITGAATIAFAREEQILARLPHHDLDDYYARVVLPFKHRLDVEYMARATFFSDLKLIVDSVLRRWDPTVVDRLLESEKANTDGPERTSNGRISPVVSVRVIGHPGGDLLEEAEQMTEV